jgi:hypothetical protein
MARVTQQRTRQALLVTGDPLDPFLVPEKLQLFNELGEPLMLGGGFARHETIETTAVMVSGEIEQDVVELYPSVRLYRIATNRPARIRLYPTESMRNADVFRSLGVKPTGNHGRLLEVVTAVNLLELVLSPAVDITSVDPFNSQFYTSITNLDSVSGAVAVTYHYFRTE